MTNGSKLLCVCSIALIWLVQNAGAQAKSEEGKRPITVADAIRMVRLGDPSYFDGNSMTDQVAHFSPDASHFLILLRQANLEENSNEYSLVLFESSVVLQPSPPEVVLKLSSSSNRESIRDLQWMSDNETIAFLGAQGAESSQVYTFNIKTRKLQKLTSHPTAISAYAIAADANKVLYLADPPREGFVNSEQTRRNGITAANEYLISLLAGDCAPTWWRSGEELYLQKAGEPARQIAAQDYFYQEYNFMSFSPDGRYAVMRSWVRGDVPKAWEDYQSVLVHERLHENQGAHLNLMRFLVLDTRDGSVAPLLNTPMEWYNDSLAWSQDSQSVQLTTRLPLDSTDSAENQERKAKLYNVEIKLAGREIRKLNALDPETVLTQETGPKQSSNTSAKIKVRIEEAIDAPPKLYVSDIQDHHKAQLLDLNPEFAGLEFGRAETVEWRVHGIDVVGGLYYPPDYSPGKRYPLVIQTHGYSADRFSMDGRDEWSSGFAARPLAGHGFFVLQAYSFKRQQDHDAFETGTDKRFGKTPEQAARNFASAAFEGAIDALDRRGLIDPNRVGIVGFSRTVAFVAYTLTHPTHPFRAAILTDGFNAGYFENLVLPSEAAETNAMYGGAAPFGKGMETWLRESPTFNLDKVQAPVRIVAFQPSSVLTMWDWYGGLSLLSKPVDLIEIPDGSHLLQKPWERRIAMAGIVDWFRFWLKGEERTEPMVEAGETKEMLAKQYERWRGLRKLQEEDDKKAAHASSPTVH